MKKIILVIVIFSVIDSFGQNRLSESNFIGWYTLNFSKNFNSKWGVQGEIQWRRNHLITDWQQGLYRVGLNYNVNAQVQLQTGFAYIDTYPYGEYNIASIAKTFPEYRTHQQVILKSKIGNVNSLSRLRLEQRWVGRYTNINLSKPDQSAFFNRVRYMYRLDIPLKGNWTTSVFDEVMIQFGKQVGENIFDQNRIGLLLGYRINNQVKIEVGFLNQTIQLGREINNKNVYQYNSGLLLNTTINLK